MRCHKLNEDNANATIKYIYIYIIQAVKEVS